MNYILKNKLTDVGDPFEGEKKSSKPIDTKDDCHPTYRLPDLQTTKIPLLPSSPCMKPT